MVGGLDGVSNIEGGIQEGLLGQVATNDIVEAIEVGFLVVGMGMAVLVLIDGDVNGVGIEARLKDEIKELPLLPSIPNHSHHDATRLLGHCLLDVIVILIVLINTSANLGHHLLHDRVLNS